MNDRVKNVIKEVEQVAKESGVKHLYLFGSYARGCERLGSDIDIVVKGANDFEKVKKRVDDIMTLYTINLFDYDNIKNKALLEEIDGYAKTIY